MSDIKITDLVDQSTIDKIKELNTAMKDAVNTYSAVASELAKGLNVRVSGIEELNELQRALAERTREASQAQTQINNVMSQQQAVIANTTNTISRQLMELERKNKLSREEYTDGEKVKQMVGDLADSYENHTRAMAQLTAQMQKNSKEQKDLQRQFKNGAMSQAEYIERQAQLIAKQRELQLSKSQLSQVMKLEEKMNSDNAGSINNLSHQLELLKKTYKDMSEAQRESPIGQEFEMAIQNLDARLKDMSADIGEFQRNVGNYAIAGQNGVVSTESLNQALTQEAVTMKDVADQTKILEEAKTMLNTNDANYQQTLDTLNSKIEENRQRLTDVTDIMNKDAKTASEAEEQNKRLSEALKHIDVTAVGAKDKIAQINKKIEENNKVVKQASGNTDEFSNKLLSMLGVNGKLGASLKGLGEGGNIIGGLNIKTKAFVNTLKAVVTNPYMLALLGIVGIAAGVKWWYDYNKGMEEASRLTKNFTDATGDTADKITTDIKVLADHTGKGFKETIEAANVLVQQYGISWNEAIGLMSKGIQAGADMGGNFLNNIKQFAPAIRDLGTDAEQLIAILAETRNGVFDERGVQNIVKGGTRLRAMTANIARDLDAVGISSQKMKEDLNNGTITMLEALQQVAGKLKELPTNSQEAGNIMKDIFGKTAAEGGTLLIQSIADINTNLDESIKKMGRLGELNGELMQSERELQELIAAVFKMSDTSFEEMNISAKVYLTQGLVSVIKGIIDICNWFAQMYNNSIAVRGAVQSIGNGFKLVWDVAKLVFKNIIDIFAATGEVLDGVFTLDLDKIRSGIVKGTVLVKKNLVAFGREAASDFSNAFNRTISDRINPIEVSLSGDVYNGVGGKVGGGTYNPKNGETGGKGGKNSNAQNEMEERKKIIQAGEDALLQLLYDADQRKYMQEQLSYKRQMATLKDKLSKVKEGDIELRNAYNNQIELLEKEHNEKLAEIEYNRIVNSNNNQQEYYQALLEGYSEGSAEELSTRLKLLQIENNKEVAEIAKMEAQKTITREQAEEMRASLVIKYAEKQLQTEKEVQAKKVKAIEEEQAEVEIVYQEAYLKQVLTLRTKYEQELKAAGDNAKKRKKIEENFQEEMNSLANDYAIDSANRAIHTYEKLLSDTELSLEERVKVEQRIVELKDEAERLMNGGDGKDEDDYLIPPETMDMISKIAGAFSDMFSGINDLSQQLFDNQIEKIEQMQEALEEAKDSEIEGITELVEKKVITEEEGEARKRAAELKTAKENEKLEKKKQALKIKQAKWDKANSIAQATIQTALAVLNALNTQPFWLGIALAAVAGAMGAVQIATIAATPIPAYAKGTEHHKGGKAIVGDAGKREVILVGSDAWVTPDTPTLVDLPQGAKVVPSLAEFNNRYGDYLPQFNHPQYDDKNVLTHIDRLNGSVSELASLYRMMIKQNNAIAYEAKFENYKNRI